MKQFLRRSSFVIFIFFFACDKENQNQNNPNKLKPQKDLILPNLEELEYDSLNVKKHPSVDETIIECRS